MEPTSRDLPSGDQVAAWIAQARGGCKESMGHLAESFRDYLLLIANQEMDPGLRAKCGASDIVQETLLDAQAAIGDFRGNTAGEFRAWMREILLNDLVDVRRRHRDTKKRNANREVPLVGESRLLRDGRLNAEPEPTPGTEALLAEEAERLRTIMLDLPAEYVTVIRLRNWQQLTFTEIGERMQRSEEAARKLWSRAITRLQAELDRAHESERTE